jgi:hypothetical protein
MYRQIRVVIPFSSKAHSSAPEFYIGILSDADVMMGYLHPKYKPV